MAHDSLGTHNQPQYATTGAPADAADLSEIANYAALVGNSKTGTTTAMNALTGADVWEGLLFGNTTDGLVYKYTSGAFKKISTIDDSGITTPTLAASWLAFGAPFATPSYRMVNGWVFLFGMMKSGTLNTTIFTLPAGMRPLAQRQFQTQSGTGGATINVFATGAIQVAQYNGGGSNANVSLDQVGFFGEQ